MKKAYANLASNSIVFTIANLGSKLITIIMVPFYTYLLSTEEYGTIDLISTTSSMFLPIVFLSIADALLRYALDKRYDKKEIFSTALLIYFIGAIVVFPIIWLLRFFIPNVAQYLLLCVILLVFNGLTQIMSQFMRATGHSKAFAINGVLYTLTFVICNILMLVVFKTGVSGYIFSIIIADAVCIIFGAIITKVWKYITLKLKKTVLLMMLKYSIPLIPNALMWGIMDASDKFVIAYFLGVEANGVYAISKKLPTLIDTFHGIFHQAWQISAIEENDSSDVKGFSSKIYSFYYILMFIVVSLLLVVARPLLTVVLSEEYKVSWQYVPFLLISVVFSSLSGFLSAKFIAIEKTGIILKTTILGAVLNILFNFILIPTIGINGAAIATALSFLAVLTIREKTSIKGNMIEVNFSRWFIWLVIACEILAYYLLPMWWGMIINAVLFAILIFLTRGNTFPVLKIMIKKIFKKV